MYIVSFTLGALINQTEREIQMLITTFQEKIDQIKTLIEAMTAEEYARFGAQFESDLKYFEEKEANRKS